MGCPLCEFYGLPVCFDGRVCDLRCDDGLDQNRNSSGLVAPFRPTSYTQHAGMGHLHRNRVELPLLHSGDSRIHFSMFAQRALLGQKDEGKVRQRSCGVSSCWWHQRG